MKLFKQLLVVMLALTLTPTAVFGWLAITANRDALVTSALELAGERVNLLQLQIGQEVLQATTAVERAAGQGIDGLAEADRRELIGRALSSESDLAAVTLLGPGGARIAGLQAFRSAQLKPGDLAAHDAAAAALLASPAARGELRVSPVYRTGAERTPALTVVVGTGGSEVAAVAGEIRLGRLEWMIARQRIAPARTYVVDAEGRVVAHSDPGLASVGPSFADNPVVKALLRSMPALSQSGSAQVGEQLGGDGERLIAAFAVVPHLSLGVVYEQPREAAYAQVTGARDRALWGLLGTAILAALIAAFAARSVVRPVRDVVEGALQIARGGFGTEVTVQSRNELGDLAHTFNYMSRQLLTYDAENKELYDSLERGYMETITALANAVDSKDPYTRGHSMRVAELAKATGEEMKLSAVDLKALLYGGILHDVGKIGIPEAILLKQARLSPEEMKVMREHPVIGANIVGGVKFLSAALPCVRNHHERWDGRGYPDALKAEDIPLVARIVNCADTYDAITSTRPYQKATSSERALEILESLRGKQIDGAVLDAFVKVIGRRRAAGLAVSELDEPGGELRAASGG